jgi:NTE family protein
VTFQTPKIGLALSGGAARGIAHIGVLREFVNHNIPIDFVAGTSAGSIVGGAYAAGLPMEDLESMGRSLKWRDIGRVTLSKLGIQSNLRLEEMLRARFPVTKFEDMKIPFAAIATDLHLGTSVVMSGTGDLPFAIRASCTLPGLYVPVVDEKGRHLVDGGLVANIPAAEVRALGAEIVIAVDVNFEGARFLGPPTSAIGVIFQSMMVIQRTVAAHELSQADVVVRPLLGHIRWDEVSRAKELIEAGAEAAKLVIPQIRQLLEPPEVPARKWYQLRRNTATPLKSDRKPAKRLQHD